MAQNVLVDLDLNANLIHNLADAVDPLDAVNKQQLDAVITGGHDPAVAGSGIAPIDPVLQSVAVLVDPAVDNMLTVGPTGLYVATVTAPVQGVTGAAPVVATDAAGIITVGLDQTAIDGAIAYVDAGDATLQTAIDAEVTARTDADLLKADKVVTVTPGLGLQGGGTLAGPDIAFSVLVDPAAGNQLTVGPTGLLVAPAAAAAVTDVVGVAGETIVTDTAGSHAVGIDPLYTQARTDYTDAGDLVLSDRIDAISIVGTGAAVVTKGAVDDWTVHVETLQLANTYVGPGTDAATIAADVVTQGGVQEPGDLYINATTGTAFVCTGLAAPDDWVELASAPAGIQLISPADTSITVTGGIPTTSLQVSAALQAEITASTATNLVQDADILALEASSHVAAASGNGASVDPVSQVVSVVADPAAGNAVVVSAAGVLVNLDAYTTDAELAASQAAQDAVIATKADNLRVINAGIGLQGGGNLTGDVTIDVGVSAAGGILADASGIWIDTGKALVVDADGLSVNVGTGLVYNATTDAIDVDATTTHVPAVSGSGAVAVDLTTQAVSLVIDPASDPALAQSATGLSLTLPPAANVVAGDVTTDAAGAGTFAHGLNTLDVTVSVKAGGCYVTAGVCEVDANTISIEALPSATYRVIVAGVII